MDTLDPIRWAEEQRGLDTDLLLRMELIGEAPASAAGSWIALHYREGDKLTATKYRRIDVRDFRWSKGGRSVGLFNADCITDPGLREMPLVICEGELDALSILSAGYMRVVSVPHGADDKPVPEGDDAALAARYKIFERYPDILSRRTPIILAADNDGPGMIMRDELVRYLGPERVRIVDYPEGCKDANDVLVRLGPTALRQIINRARYVQLASLRTFNDYPPGHSERVLEVWRPGISDAVDKHIGILPGYCSVWTGIPGQGKSVLINQVLLGMCRSVPGLKAAIASLEASPNREWRRHAMQYLIGKPPQEWRDDERDEAARFLADHVVVIDPDPVEDMQGRTVMDEATPTLQWFLDTAAAAVIRHGVRFIVLDPWGEIEQDRTSGQAEYEFVGQALGRINRLCRALDCHVAIVAHPRKMERDKKSASGYAIPGPYDISGAAAWANKVSLGVTMHREPELDEAGEVVPGTEGRNKIWVWKSKLTEVQGKPGEVFVHYDPRGYRLVDRSVEARRAF